MDGGQAWIWAGAAAGLAGGWWLGRRGRARPAVPASAATVAGPAAAPAPAAAQRGPEPVAVAVQAPTAVAAAPLDHGAAELTAADPQPSTPPDDLRAQLEVLRRTEEAAEAERDDLLAERDTLSRQISDQRQRIAALSRQSAEQQAQLQHAEGERATLAQQLAELTPLPAALAKAQGENAALQDQLRAAAHDIRTLHAEVRAGEQRIAAAQDRLAQLEAALAQAVGAERLRAAEAEAEAEAEKLRSSETAEQLQALQEAHSGLQRQAQTLHGATHRARKLALQLREAQAAVAAARALVAAEGLAVSAELAPDDEALAIGEVAKLVATWASQPGVQAVAVADGRGLMVAGQGAEAPALAARASSLYRALQQQSGWSAGLTLGGADAVQIRDKNGLSMLIRPWQAPGGALLLAVLARQGVETQPWAADVLRRGHSVFVWSNPWTRDKRVPAPAAPVERMAP